MLLAILSTTIVILTLSDAIGKESDQKGVALMVFTILALASLYGTLYFTKLRLVLDKDILNIYGFLYKRNLDLSKLTSAKSYYTSAGLQLRLADNNKTATIPISAFQKSSSKKLLAVLKPYVLSDKVDTSKNITNIFN